MGGGNSGLEEGLFLTQFADHVTVVQGMSKLTANKLLQDKVANHPKMSVLLDTTVKSFNANAAGKLESITLSCDGTDAKHETAGAFVFIGLDPNTSVPRELTRRRRARFHRDRRDVPHECRRHLRRR